MLVTRQIHAKNGACGRFVDWLSLRQTHKGGGLPIVSDGVVWATDEDGQVRWKTIKASRIEGSFETALQVRCDGETVWFSGNVSRFGRADNLFGFSFEECLTRVNEVLASLGLPPFTKGHKYYEHARSARSSFSSLDKPSGAVKLKRAWSGAVVTRVDLTANYETGSLSNARAYMEWLATQQGSRIKVGTHGDGETIDWGRGSRALYSKAYLKSQELRKHGGDERLIGHCEAVGLVRFELTFKATWLHNNDCHYLGDFDMKQLEIAFDERAAVLSRAEHTVDDLALLPKPLRCTARDYLAGDDLATRMSLRTFQRHRAGLLPFGIDIAVRRNVIDFKPRVRTIEVRPASVPSWYDFGERKVA